MDFKVEELPSKGVPNSRYYVTLNSTQILEYVTDKYGNFRQVVDPATFAETDPIFAAWLATPPNLSEFVNDVGYITAVGAETDPVWTAEKVNYLTIATAALTYQPITSNITTQGNIFNGVNQLVKLDGLGKLPAIDGSQLTNLPEGVSKAFVVAMATAL